MITENHDRILDFAEPIRIWQIQIAKRVANEMDEGGFASLFIVSSLFELFGRLQSNTNVSKQNFITGFVEVFPEFEQKKNDPEFIEMLFNDFRGGMYHWCIPRCNVKVDKTIQVPIEISGTTLRINPIPFIERVETYFNNLLELIRSRKSKKVNENFGRFIVLDPSTLAQPTYFSAFSGSKVTINDENRHLFSCCYPCVNPFKNSF